MKNELFVVKYKGFTGFMRPHNAIFVKSTRTETFITPSRLQGIQRFLGTSTLIRSKVQCDDIFNDQVSIRCPDPKAKKQKDVTILGTMLNPVVYLGFESEEDAKSAFTKSICLRVEDILLPIELLHTNFDLLIGCEFVETGKKTDKYVGIHRYTMKPMFGKIEITGYFLKPNYE